MDCNYLVIDQNTDDKELCASLTQAISVAKEKAREEAHESIPYYVYELKAVYTGTVDVVEEVGLDVSEGGNLAKE